MQQQQNASPPGSNGIRQCFARAWAMVPLTVPTDSLTAHPHIVDG